MKIRRQQLLTAAFIRNAIFLFITLTVLPSFANPDNYTPLHSEDLGVLIGTSEVTDTYCGACNGAIDLTVTGGVFPYTYSWSNGEMTEDLNNLCIGLYEVTVTDANSCTYQGNIFVGNNSFPDVYLESQADVDNYVDNFSFCPTVNGTLRIGTTFANPPSDISDISGLSFITSVGSNLQIFQNPNLTSLNGLQNITTLGSGLNITNNNGLINLVGLPPLTAINGSLAIDNLSSLQTLEGLNQLVSVGGTRIYISNTTDLVSLSALSQLQNVDGDLDIRICLDLTSLNGLEQLATIGGDLVLRDNIILNDLSALDHAISIGGDLIIKNTDLTACAVESICDMLQDGATSDISDNNMGCNTADEILMACSGNTLIIDEVQVTPFSCAGICDASILLTVEGGTAPYEYLWSNGETTNPLLDACPILYSVTVTDAEGLTAETSLSIAGPEDMVIEITDINPACFGQCFGSVDLLISGGVPPYMHDLPSDLCAGDYTFTVTDANGCTVDGNFNMPGSEALSVDLDNIIDAVVGQNSGSIEITVVGGTAPFLFEWVFGSLSGPVVSLDEDPIGLVPGDYLLNVIDSLGCITPQGTYTVGTMVGLEDFETNVAIQIFPNPAKEGFQVETASIASDNITYSLWNTLGSQIKTGMLSQNSGARGYIGAEDLEPGIYFLQLEVEEKTLIQKVVIQ